MKKVLKKIKAWFIKLGKKIKCIKWKKVFEKARNISLLVGGIAVMFSCIIYVFASDLFATNNSVWLLCGSLLGFGAGAFALLSEMKKENKILTYSLKGVGLALMIGFVVFLTFFEKSSIVTSLDETDKYLGIECLKALKVSMVFTYVLSYIGIAVQAFNITSNAILGIEE